MIHKTTPEEVRSWILHEDADLIVLNKDGELPCHPSKDGPWSSLAGAVREYFGAEAAHLVFRLDRETSGAVVFARHAAAASRLQTAAQEHRYEKVYVAILCGELPDAVVEVDQPLGDDHDSPVAIKTRVVPAGSGQPAQTRFERLATGGGFTFVRVTTGTGRKHQIRAHASWLGYPLVGDKIYGPDPMHFLEFIKDGWTPRLEGLLHLRRQALHCCEIDLKASGVPLVFRAPVPSDMAGFLRDRMGVDVAGIRF